MKMNNNRKLEYAKMLHIFVLFYSENKAPLTGEFLNSVINKILVIDKEHIIYLIPKSQF